jgi:hypothetical protein
MGPGNPEPIPAAHPCPSAFSGGSPRHLASALDWSPYGLAMTRRLKWPRLNARLLGGFAYKREPAKEVVSKVLCHHRADPHKRLSYIPEQ